MSGTFVCIVGASGAGKDTLIDGARSRLGSDHRFIFPRRIVTRQSSDSEDHDTLSVEEFRAIEARDGFALSWCAHGLDYAIPHRVRDDVAQGKTAICNLSRSAVADARRQFKSLRVVLITSSPDLIRQRLLSRGREAPARVDSRIDREVLQVAPEADLTIENVGALDISVSSFVTFLTSIPRPDGLSA